MNPSDRFSRTGGTLAAVVLCGGLLVGLTFVGAGDRRDVPAGCGGPCPTEPTTTSPTTTTAPATTTTSTTVEPTTTSSSSTTVPTKTGEPVEPLPTPSVVPGPTTGCITTPAAPVCTITGPAEVPTTPPAADDCIEGTTRWSLLPCVVEVEPVAEPTPVTSRPTPARVTLPETS